MMRTAATGLAEMEQQFQKGLLGQSRDILAHVNGNARENAEVMFGVYQHAYWARLAESLGADFPGLKSLAGDAEFDRIARAYIARHPSVDPSIRWAGRLLPEFLAKESPWRDDPWWTDMARFDWALAHAFDAADAPAATLAQLAVVPPEFWGGLRLKLHPTLDSFEVSTPVDEIRPRLLADARAGFDRAARRPGAVMAWRIDYDLKFRPIDANEQAALDAARTGATFGDICELLAARMAPDQAVMTAAQILRGWLEWGVIEEIEHDAPGSAA